MTFSVKRSFLRHNPWFEVAAAAHAKEMRDWLEREENVARDANNPNIPEIDRWAPCPRPAAPHPDVESAVNEKGYVEFDVENDDPTPEDLLPAKKNELLRSLQVAESAARDAIMPINKRPLHEIRKADVVAADHARQAQVSEKIESVVRDRNSAYTDEVERVRSEWLEKSVLSRAAGKIFKGETLEDAIAKIPPPTPPDVDAVSEVDGLRSDDDRAFLAEARRISEADDAVTRAVAQALHDIEDLTVNTVDYYVIPDLTKQV